MPSELELLMSGYTEEEKQAVYDKVDRLVAMQVRDIQLRNPTGSTNYSRPYGTGYVPSNSHLGINIDKPPKKI